MRYLGGKTKQAKAICDIMKPETYSRVWDAFVGGGSITAEICRRVVESRSDTLVLSSDANGDLIEMWRAVKDGWLPCERHENLTDTEYRLYKASESSPLRTFVGFSSSFGGKFFGGNARDTERIFYEESRRDLVRKSRCATVAEFSIRDFNAPASVPPGTLVYCDPPYKGTTGYAGTAKFDHDLFWARCRDLVDRCGAVVYVSEFQAPDFCEIVWQRPRKSSVKRKDHAVLPETLFRVKPCPHSTTAPKTSLLLH